MKTDHSIFVEALTHEEQIEIEKRSEKAPVRNWRLFFYSPLWLCFLIAIGVRGWLVIHTHGFIDGDEALVGVQAQHILQGEHPIYYYGQPYMGSLESYLLAVVFACVGSSAWALRAVTTVLSLGVVGLTWKLAGALASSAGLSWTRRRWFMFIASLLAACPPLYDLVIELRTWGGHVEIYILMLWLLYSVLRLTQRWDEGLSLREAAWRWSGIGLLIGVGLWVYPLIALAILTILIWISVFVVRRLYLFQHLSLFWSISQSVPLCPRFYHWERIRLALLTLPMCLLGFAPGLYWGAQHQWANVLYLFSPGSDGGNDPLFLSRHPNQLAIWEGTVKLYLKCLAPEVLGGSLPSQSITRSTQLSFGLLTAIAGIVFATILLGIGTSFFLRSQLLTIVKRLATLPMIFAGSTMFVFCFSHVVGGSIFQPCTRDGVGRYAAPLLLVLPFLGATICTVGILAFQKKTIPWPVIGARKVEQKPKVWSQKFSLFTQYIPVMKRHRLASPSTQNRGLLFMTVTLILYLGLIGNTYIQSQPAFVFQSFACLYAPFDREAVQNYLAREHIHYIWSTINIGNVLMFETHERIIVSDPRIIVNHALDRLPQNVAAIQKAEKVSLIDMVLRTDAYPRTLQMLDQAHVTYHVERFHSEPGNMDLLVITPLNRTLNPSEAFSFGLWNLRC